MGYSSLTGIWNRCIGIFTVRIQELTNKAETGISVKVLLIIPAYNEEENIVQVIKTIQEKCPDVDYLVVNDCSTDNTLKQLESVKANYVNGPVNLGIGGAVQTGYRYAFENNYDVAIQVDGDGQHDVSYVSSMVQKIADGEADIVIGSRFVDKEGFQSTATRRTGIMILSFFIWICTGKRVKDVTSGFRAVNSKFIKIFANDYPEDYPEPEAIVMGVIHGGKVIEYPVIMKERLGGTSSINLRKSVYYMIKVSLAIFMRRFSLGFRRR